MSSNDSQSIAQEEWGKGSCTIFQICWFRIRTTLHHGKFDLIKVLALDARSLLEAFLGFRKFLVLQLVSNYTNKYRVLLF